MLNKTPKSVNVIFYDFDPSPKWVVKTQEPRFDDENLSWMDLDPPPPSRTTESSRNPTIDSQFTNSKNEDEDQDQDEDEDNDSD